MKIGAVGLVVGVLVVSAGATWGLAEVSAEVREAAVAVATVVTGLATAAAAFFARGAAVESANAARTARVALAKHSPSTVRVVLARRDGGPWTWWVALLNSPTGALQDVELVWRASGQAHQRSTSLSQLAFQLPEDQRDSEVWQVPTFTLGDEDVHGIATAIPTVRVSWTDPLDRYVRWSMEGKVENPTYEPTQSPDLRMNTMDPLPGRFIQASVQWSQPSPTAI